MVNAILKIKEMQKKLSIINNNIDEIKKERKSFEKNRKLTDELIYNDSFNKNNKIEKNLVYKNNLIRNNSNNMHPKNLKNISNYNHFKINQTYTITNRKPNIYENNSKFNNDYICNKIKNDENFIDNYSNKKNNFKKNKTCSISMSENNRHRIIHNCKKSQTKNNFYKRSFIENNINYYQNKFINSSNINENSKEIFSYGNNNKNNYLKTTKRNIKIKNYFNKSNIKSCSNNNIGILNNNDYNKKNIINDNYLFVQNRDNNDNIKEKIELRNNSINKTTMCNKNKKNDFQKNNGIEFFNIRPQKNLSFNSKNNYEINKINDNNNYLQNRCPISAIDLKRNIPTKNNVNYEQIVLDIIDITNQYNNKENKVNIGNIVDEYKILLGNIKLKDKFIHNITNQFNKLNKAELNSNDPRTLIPIWNWILSNENKFNNNSINEEKEYTKICKEIMKKYKINNIHRFKKFINKSLQKIDTNENFLEGIKKILST